MKHGRKTLSLALALLMGISLTACGPQSGGETPSPSLTPPSPSPSPTDAPLDLSGQWKQIDSEFDGKHHGAVISGDTIEIYNINDEDGTRSLYWSGSFAIPDSSEEIYSWISENNKERTELSLNSSSDDTKEFTYEEGQISYSTTTWGTTYTVCLEHGEWAPDLSEGQFYAEEPISYTVAGVEFLISPCFKESADEKTDDGTIFYMYSGSLRRAILAFYQISTPISQEEFDKSKDMVIERFFKSSIGEDVEIQASEDIILAGMSGKFSIGQGEHNGVTYRVYFAFTYNKSEEKLLCIYLLPLTQNDNTKFFKQIIDSARLLDSDDPAETSAPLSGIRPEFKEALDSYEAFMDEYVAFMKRYQDSDGSLSMLTDYLDYLSRYADMMEKFGEIGEGDLTTEETLYYLEVSNRITQKLLEAAG